MVRKQLRNRVVLEVDQDRAVALPPPWEPPVFVAPMEPPPVDYGCLREDDRASRPLLGDAEGLHTTAAARGWA